jgi:DNA recombination protein RmuC
MWIAVVAGGFLVAALVYAIGTAVRLINRLLTEKLDLLAQKASQELESREKLIKDLSAKLVAQQQHTATATAQFKMDLGAVLTKIEGLKDLQGRISELNDLLKPQQLRGELGEVIVRTLIADKLPSSQYEEDHAFADGKKVEFAIRLNERWIPVDSKLQLEDFKRMREAPEERRPALRSEFKRTIRQKIDEVRQYIKPDEGTWNFALMVIPSEAVYYELVASRDFVEAGGVYDYARGQQVFLVSPLTFWAYLTVIAQGLQGLEIGRRAEEILASLETIGSHLQMFVGTEFRLVGEHLRNAKTKYDEACDTLQEIEADLTMLKRLKTEQPTEVVG